MNTHLELVNVTWQCVCVIPRKSRISGYKDDLYRSIIAKSQRFTETFNCYRWASRGHTYYCGSYRSYADKTKRNMGKEVTTNLGARIYNYLKKHGVQNARVAEEVNRQLKRFDVVLSVLRFEALELYDRRIDFATFTRNVDYLHAVEELLIAVHKQIGQCEWNTKNDRYRLDPGETV